MDLENLAIVINARIDGFEAGIDKAEKGLGRLSNYAKTTGASLTQYVTLPLGLLGAASIKTAADIQALEKGFAAVYKGAGDVGAEIKKTLEIAKLPGLGLKEALQGATNLQAAGYSAEQARRTLLAFGGALATVGKGKVELDRVTLALTQINNSTNVMQQDLNQLKDALPQIGTVLKSAFGVSNAEGLRKLGVTSQQFIEVVTTEFEKLPKVTGGLKNALENMSDAGVLALAKIGDAASNAIGLEALADKISTQVGEMATAFASLDPATQSTILGFAGVAAGAGPLLFSIGAIGQAIPVAVNGFKALSGAGSFLVAGLGPVGIAIAAVTAGLVYFVATSKSAQDEFADASTAAGNLASQLNPLLSKYEELSKKTNLTAVEQENLKDIIRRIAEVTPGAITATDEYGNAMQISTTKAKSYLKALQNIAKAKAEPALKPATENFNDLSTRLKQVQAQLDKFNKTRVTVAVQFDSRGIQLPDKVVSADTKEGDAFRKELTNRINLTRKAQLESLSEVNKIRSTIGMKPLVDAEDKRDAAALAAAKKKAKAILDSRAALEAEIQALEKETSTLSLVNDAEKIASNNKLIAAKQEQIRQIDELGIGSKAEAKSAAKDISDLAKAQDAFRDGLRKVNNEFKLQGEAYDVAGEKARVYKTFMDKLIELDKTGKVEQSPQFKAASAEYVRLIELSNEYKQNADFKQIFLNAEEAITATGEQILALGKNADESVERVKILEAQLSTSLQAVEALRKKGAEENNRFLAAEIEHAKVLQQELEKARVAAAQAKRDAAADDLLEGLNSASPGARNSLTGGGDNFADLASGKAQDELEERIRRSQQAIKELQTNGASEAMIRQAQDAVAGLKSQLDLTDVYAGAAAQASAALADIGLVIVEGIGNIITGQMSVTEGLRSIFGQTLSIIGNFMKDFGKQLLLLGAGHVALGLATGNAAMVTAGGLELAAGGALALAGTLVGFGGKAIAGGNQSSTPSTSAIATPTSNVTKTKENNLLIEVKFLPVELRAEGTQLRSVMQVDSYRLTNTR
ncbi:tape measure protein [Hymenobacter canadensis]|uniref:Tape measure protein n=1 Tax=Hymenobacter canadensis TaxID=2999067 RepID=A0ABY7LW61_9BACT|nr:tape measure protein [Hymenobacter canadensis]WBA43163.1 tape measure protein [Hymenobacter canadensis]